MEIPPFPLEITDLVIDHLRENRKTLKSCSLVCWAWVSRTRHHLFFILNIRTRPIPALDLLQSPLCTIHSHVRGLKLGSINQNPLDIAVMITLIREINARSTLLLLSACGRPTLVSDELQTLFSTLKNLRYLKLQYFRFESFEHRIRLLASLPALESLVLYGVDLSDNLNVDSHSEGGQNSLVYATPPPANLRQVFIQAINDPHELRWLTAHGHPLTTLHLRDITPESLPVVLDYLRQSSHIQCLSFDFCMWETSKDQFDLMARMDLTSHRDLRRLRINSCWTTSALSILLSRVCSSYIEEITMSAGNCPANFSWVDLRSILMSPAVRSLKRLYTDPEDIRKISEAMPEFASHGIILPLREGTFERGTEELSLSPIFH